MSSLPSPLSSPSPRQAHMRRKLATPAAAGALELFKEASIDGSQQQQPVPTFVSRSQRKRGQSARTSGRRIFGNLHQRTKTRSPRTEVETTDNLQFEDLFPEEYEEEGDEEWEDAEGEEENFPRPRQQNASSEEQDDTPRAGVEAKTPSKMRMSRDPSPLPSPSRRRAHIRLKVATPASKLRMSSHRSPLISPSPRQAHMRRKLATPAAARALELFKEASIDGSQQQQPAPAFVSKKLWPDSSVEDIKNVPGSTTLYALTGTRRLSTSAQMLADLNCALDKSLFWKPTKVSMQSPLGGFLSCKKADKNNSKGWLRRGLGLRSTGHLAKEETKILTAMFLSLSGTTPYAARELAFAWGQTEQTMRSASKKYLQILMTKEPPAPSIHETMYKPKALVAEMGCQIEPSVVEIECQIEPSVVEIECQTEQTTLGTSYVDDGCQTISCVPVDTESQTEVSLQLDGSNEHAQILAYDVIKTRIEGAVNGMFSLLSKDLRVHQFLKLPKPRQSQGARSQSVTKVAKLLKPVITALCINPEEESKVVDVLVSNYGNITLSKSDDNISVDHIIAIRDAMHSTTNGVNRLVAAIKKLQPKLGALFPTRVKHNIAKREKTAEIGAMQCEKIDLIVKSDGTKKSCLHFWATSPPLVLESLVANAVLTEDSFQESNEFCRKKGKLIIIFGCDKGGVATSLLIRVANRKDGNAPAYCMPLAIYEDGSENYYNLSKSIFCETKPAKNFLQLLLDDGMHMVVIASKDSGEHVEDARGVLLAIQNRPSDATRIVVDSLPDLNLGGADNFNANIVATERSGPIPVNISSLARRLPDDESEVHIQSQLVKKGDEYIGCVLFDAGENEVLCRFQFEDALLVPVENGSVVYKCYHVIGFPANDTKMSVAISGQSSCSSSCPCLTCVAQKSEFNLFPTWMHEHDPTIPESQCKDFALRVGLLSNANSFKKWMGRAGQEGELMLKRTGPQAVAAKKEVYSVVQPPLYNTPVSKETFCPMHMSQGVFTHLSKDIREILRSIDSQGFFFARAKAVLEEVEAFVKDDTSYKLLQKKDGELFHQISLAEEGLSDNAHSDASALDIQLASVRKEREQHAQQSGYASATLLRKGAENLLPALKKYFTSKKPRGPAEFAYNAAQEIIGGVRFRAEHSGYELSNSHGIMVLEKCVEIATIIEMTYPDEPERRKEVIEAMRIFRSFSKSLLPLSKLMKSQGKIDGAAREIIKDFIVDIGKLWRAEFPDKQVFNKLHHLFHLIRFLGEWEFCGRGSEEGFEAFHPFLARLLRDLKAMASTQARVQTASQRFSIRLNPEIQAIGNKLTTKGSKRGQYKPKEHVTRANESLPIGGGDNSDSTAPDGLFKLGTGEYLKNEWLAVAELAMSGKAPTEWKEVFANQQLGNSMSTSLEYITL